MKIFLTIDVECYSGDYEREVWGEGLGLEFILSTLGKFGIKATFFVEALGATQWGLEPVARICDSIRKGGHEIGLHVHPVTARIDGFEDRFDTIWRQDYATQVMLIRKGLEILKECGVSDVRSFRAGSLAANEDTIRAMEENGLFISSNRDLDVKSSIESKLNDYFPVRNDISRNRQIVDVPVSCLHSPLPWLDGRFRHLEISAVSSREMGHALTCMSTLGYASATILTHPREFYRTAGAGYSVIRKNCRRWECLLNFLAETREGFPVMPMATSAGMDMPLTSPPEVRGNFVLALERVMQQGVDRWVQQQEGKTIDARGSIGRRKN